MSENKKQLEAGKRKREKTYIIATILLLGLFITLQYLAAEGAMKQQGSSGMTIFILTNVNLLLLLVLLYLVFKNLSKAFLDYRRGAGSRLKFKLVLSFLALSIAPSFILFGITSTFISTSMERWFNVQIEHSLSEALNVARTFYKSSSDNALFYSRTISRYIRDNALLDQEKLQGLVSHIAQKKGEFNLESIEVFSSLKERLVSDIPQGAQPTAPVDRIITDALSGKETVTVEESARGDIVRASVPIMSTFVATEPVGVVIVSYHLPHTMMSRMQVIQETYDKYAKLLMFRKPLKSTLVVMLLITTSVIIFTAIWFGMHMARRLTDPLDEMTEAAVKVSNGDMDIHVDATSVGEIGHLATAFNRMVHELKERKDIIESQANYLTILTNKVSAGILSVSPQGSVVTVNDAFRQIFESTAAPGADLSVLFTCKGGDEITQSLRGALDGFVRERIIPVVVGEREKIIKLDIAPMTDENQRSLGIVAVFEDITRNIRFQKMLAWREVARKVAHEIKNPLTPIQLSAQRLKKKYGHLITEERETFDECIALIVDQVEDIRNLISEFSNFGRMPEMRLERSSVHTVVNDICSLFREAHKSIGFVCTVGDNIPEVSFDANQLRRALMNIITNAVEAIGDRQGGIIVVDAGSQLDRSGVYIRIADNGPGIPDEFRDKLFEPYFSRKQGGTGLGLYIVHSIISDHGGTIQVRSAHPQGTEFFITLPAAPQEES